MQNTSFLGTNLGECSYYSTELPFLDLFKTSSGWIAGNDSTWSTGEESQIDIDQYGWVKSLPGKSSNLKFTRVSTLLNRVMKDKYPSGNYVVLYDGTGQISYKFDATLRSSSPGRDVIYADASLDAGICLTIESTDTKGTGDYLRNIRIVQAEHEADYQSIFNPLFLEKLKHYKAIRFMCWGQINNSPQKQWSRRPLPQQAFYNSNLPQSSIALDASIPIEIMIALANRLQVSPWFNIPHMADDDYVTNLAALIKASLLSTLSFYIEYSNEVWNYQFQQAKWVEQEGIKAWSSNSDTSLARNNWYGLRTVQISKIFKQVFSDNPGRVKCVLSGQAANPQIIKDIISSTLANVDVCGAIFGIAIAPYFGMEYGDPYPSTTSDIQGLTVNQLIKKLHRDSILKTYDVIDYHAVIASQHNVKLLSYEGGQSLVGYNGAENNGQLSTLFMNANRDQGMYSLYLSMLDYWSKTEGTEAFMHFINIGTPSKWGSWGALEYLLQVDSPKYNALQWFMTIMSGCKTFDSKIA